MAVRSGSTIPVFRLCLRSCCSALDYSVTIYKKFRWNLLPSTYTLETEAAHSSKTLVNIKLYGVTSEMRIIFNYVVGTQDHMNLLEKPVKRGDHKHVPPSLGFLRNIRIEEREMYQVFTTKNLEHNLWRHLSFNTRLSVQGRPVKLILKCTNITFVNTFSGRPSTPSPTGNKNNWTAYVIIIFIVTINLKQ
jgi:hypothetical protein